MKTGFQKVVACLLPILFFCGGCATEYTHGLQNFDAVKPRPPYTGVYRGVRTYASAFTHPASDSDEDDPKGDDTIGSSPGAIASDVGITTLAICFVAIDLPLSAAADTILLPYDLTTIHNDNSNEDSDE